MKDESFEDFMNKLQNGVRNVANVAVHKVHDGINWGLNNPDKVLAGIGAGATVLQATRSLVVSHRVRTERKRIERTYYDPSSGFHWDLRRAASNNDRRIILERKKKGDDIYTILKDLNLIK